METNTDVHSTEYSTLSLNLPDEAIKEFQALFLQTYNKQISSKEASVNGIRLMRQILPVYKPIPKTRKDVSNE